MPSSSYSRQNNSQSVFPDAKPVTKKNNRLSRYLKYGFAATAGAGIGLYVLPPLVHALGTAFGTAVAGAGTAGLVTIPAGGLGLGILGATAVAAGTYGGYKYYQKHHAKKSIFSHKDIRGENDRAAKLYKRSRDLKTLGKYSGYGLYTKLQRHGIFKKLGRSNNSSENVEINKDFIKDVRNADNNIQPSPYYYQHKYQQSYIPISKFREEVNNMSLSKKLAYFCNHEFIEQLGKNRASVNRIKADIENYNRIKNDNENYTGKSYDPFKTLTEESLYFIAKELDYQARKIIQDCPAKADVMYSVADAAMSVALSLGFKIPDNSKDRDGYDQPSKKRIEERSIDSGDSMPEGFDIPDRQELSQDEKEERLKKYAMSLGFKISDKSFQQQQQYAQQQNPQPKLQQPPLQLQQQPQRLKELPEEPTFQDLLTFIRDNRNITDRKTGKAINIVTDGTLKTINNILSENFLQIKNNNLTILKDQAKKCIKSNYPERQDDLKAILEDGIDKTREERLNHFLKGYQKDKGAELSSNTKKIIDDLINKGYIQTNYDDFKAMRNDAVNYMGDKNLNDSIRTDISDHLKELSKTLKIAEYGKVNNPHDYAPEAPDPVNNKQERPKSPEMAPNYP